MEHEFKLNDAVRVKDTFEDPHYRGCIGFVWDLGGEAKPGQFVQVKDGYVGVSFDMDTTHRSPRGIAPEHLERVGDFEVFARYALSYAVNEGGAYSDGFNLMKVAGSIWGRFGHHPYLDQRLKQLHEFLTDKYGVYVPRPWDEMPERFDNVLRRNAAGEFDGGDGVGMDFKDALREAAGFNERAHRAIMDYLAAICETDTTSRETRAFVLRKYVAAWRVSHFNPYRDPLPAVAEATQ